MIKLLETNTLAKLPKIDKPTDRIYEACAEKIGLLQPDLAEDVVYVYGQMTGFRTVFFLINEFGSIPEQAAALNAALEAMQRAKKQGNDLPERLRKFAARQYWPFRDWKTPIVNSRD